MKEEKLPEKAADKKIKKLLEYAAAMIVMWTSKEKRNEYSITEFLDLFNKWRIKKA